MTSSAQTYMPTPSKYCYHHSLTVALHLVCSIRILGVIIKAHFFLFILFGFSLYRFAHKNTQFKVKTHIVVVLRKMVLFCFCFSSRSSFFFFFCNYLTCLFLVATGSRCEHLVFDLSMAFGHLVFGRAQLLVAGHRSQRWSPIRESLRKMVDRFNELGAGCMRGAGMAWRHDCHTRTDGWPRWFR